MEGQTTQNFQNNNSENIQSLKYYLKKIYENIFLFIKNHVNLILNLSKLLNGIYIKNSNNLFLNIIGFYFIILVIIDLSIEFFSWFIINYHFYIIFEILKISNNLALNEPNSEINIGVNKFLALTELIRINQNNRNI